MTARADRARQQPVHGLPVAGRRPIVSKALNTSRTPAGMTNVISSALAAAEAQPELVGGEGERHRAARTRAGRARRRPTGAAPGVAPVAVTARPPPASAATSAPTSSR